MRILSVALCAATLAGGAAGAAAGCTVPLEDLTGRIGEAFGSGAVLATGRTDPGSGEPVRRYVVDLPGGDLLVLEQQHCEMRNLRVTLLSPEASPPLSAVESMAAVLALTPEWQEGFPESDARAVLLDGAARLREVAGGPAEFSYPVDDRIASPAYASEAILSLQSAESYAAQFRSMMSLYLGIGGQ
jgi:hypothetical protein